MFFLTLSVSLVILMIALWIVYLARSRQNNSRIPVRIRSNRRHR